jgi:hypothetical protein
MLLAGNILIISAVNAIEMVKNMTIVNQTLIRLFAFIFIRRKNMKMAIASDTAMLPNDISAGASGGCMPYGIVTLFAVGFKAVLGA